MLDKLFEKYINGTISKKELDSLREQITASADEDIRILLSQMWQEENNQELSLEEKDKLFSKITHTIDDMENENTNANSSSRVFMYLRTHLLRIAAVALLLLGIGAVVWYKQYTKVVPPVISQNVLSAMQDSKKDSVESYTITKIDVRKQAMKTVLSQYCKDEEVVENLSDVSEMKTLVRKDGWLTLDDGTVVHLNGDSRLFFPEHFGHSKRDVILDGEAYFMVAKDKSRPFIVHTVHGDVKEYGTEFNVAAYKGKPTEVVLVEGSVSVTSTHGTEQMMKPNMLCRFSDEDCKMEFVDTEPYKAWNVGKFTFKDWQLERIMSVLSRWYSMPVEYAEPSLRHLNLSGTFSRYDGMDATLESLGIVTGTKITIEQGRIIINNIKF